MSALLDGIAHRISAAAGEDAGVAGVFKFDAGQDGVLVVDTTAKPATVSTTDRPADCTKIESTDAKQTVIKEAAVFLGHEGQHQISWHLLVF